MDNTKNLKEQIKEEVMSFLMANNTAVVSTIFKEEIYSSTIHYIVDEKWNMYFLTQDNSKKYFNISSNQKVAVVVGTGPKHISVQARGIARELMGDDVREILPKFNWLKDSHIIEHWPLEEMDRFQDRNLAVFIIEPLEMLFMNLDDENYPLSQDTKYHQIFP